MIRFLRTGVFCLLQMFCYFPFLHSDCIFLLISSFLFHLQSQPFSLQTSGTSPLAVSPLSSPKLSSSSAICPAQACRQPEQQPSPLSLSTCQPLQLISRPVPSAVLTFALFPKSFPNSGPVHLTRQILGLANCCNQLSQLLVVYLYIYECIYQDI